MATGQFKFSVGYNLKNSKSGPHFNKFKSETKNKLAFLTKKQVPAGM